MRFSPAALLFWLVASPVLAATNVIGTISPNTPTLVHWTTSGSPYNVTGDVTVAANTTLTIDPGVTVVVSNSDAAMSGNDPNHVEFTILGGLQANGTAGSPIIIGAASSGANSWDGFTLANGAAASSITFATITDANSTITMKTGNAPTITDLTLSNFTNGIVWQSSATATLHRLNVSNFYGTAISLSDDGSDGLTATVDTSTIESGTASTVGVSVAARVMASVLRDQFVMLGTGVIAATGSSLSLENNVIAGNAVAGVSVTQSETNAILIINNTIDQNFKGSSGTGIQIGAVTSGSNFIVRNNIVTNNGIGISVGGPIQPAADTNDVWNNANNYSNTSAGANSISNNPLFNSPLGTVPASNAAWVQTTSNAACDPGTDASGYSCGSFGQMNAGWIKVTASTGEYGSIAIADRDGNSAGSVSGSSTTTVDILGNAANVTANCGYYYYYCYGSVSVSYLPLAYDYHVGAASPVIDTGNNLGSPSVDLDGSPRPYNATQTATATADIGAYEYHANIPPTAVLSQGATVLVNTAVSFDGSGSFDTDGTVVSWDWDFGDGSNHGSGETTTHTYTTTGMVTVTLTVTDNGGATGTATATYNVVQSLPPVAVPGNPQVVTVGTAVMMDGSASYSPNGTIVSYQWNFGDHTADANTPTVSHTYTAIGTYTVTLTVTDNFSATASATVVIGVTTGGTTYPPPTASAGGPYTGTEGQMISFDGSGSAATSGTITTYAWDFGDGSSGSGVTPSHAYASSGSFLVNLTVTDSHGGTATASALATISAVTYPAPVANPGGPYTGTASQSIIFDGSASTATNGTITIYSWAFGDGTSGTGEMTQHAYSASGSFLVTLTVTDNHGGTNSASALVTVAAQVHPAPVANPGGPYSGTVSVAIMFDGSMSSATGGTIMTYAWNFGDGSTGSGVSPTHAYSEAGSFLIGLTVTDSNGGTASASTLATVAVPAHTAPNANAGGNRSTTVGTSVIFDASASMAATGSRLTGYSWNFGDGTTSNMETVSHSYAEAGSFIVTLTVTDDANATGQDIIVVAVTSGTSTMHNPPTASAGHDISANAGATVALSASGSTDPDGTITAYQWDFGDGGTAVGLSTTHVYATGGTFLITLTVFDSFGLMATATINATIFALPVANAGGDRQGTVGVALTFDGSASTVAQGTISTYSWTFGDGTVATGAMATHTYTTAGSFHASLTVTDDKGGTNTTTIAVSITAATGTTSTTPSARKAGGCSSAGDAGLIALLGAAAILRRRRQLTA